MQAYSYIPVNGHGIARVDGGNYLVDPGMPYSIAERPLLIDGRQIDVQSEVMGLDLSHMQAQVGIELDGVLGANLSDQFVVNLLPHRKSIVLDKYLSDFPIEIDVDSLAGVACMHMSVGGRRMRGVMDLGCSLSMIREDLVDGFEPIGRGVEVFGYLGPREVDVYILPVLVERRPVHLRFGVMPPEYADWLEMVNIQAALGHELLEHYAVSLAIEEGKVSLDPLH